MKLAERNKDGKSSLLGYYLSCSEEGTSVLKAQDFLTADRAFVAAAASRQFSVRRTNLSIYFNKICKTTGLQQSYMKVNSAVRVKE